MSSEVPSRRGFLQTAGAALLAAHAPSLNRLVSDQQPISLTITFNGLCLLCERYTTPNGDDKTALAYVLMPYAGAHQPKAGPFGRHCQIPVHRAAVFFDTGHLKENSTKSNHLAKIRLDGSWLTLPTFPLTKSDYSGAIPSDVYNLQGQILKCGPVPDQNLPPKNNYKSKHVASHMELTQGHFCRAIAGAKFDFADSASMYNYTKELPYQAPWFIDNIEATSIAGLKLTPYADIGGTALDFPELFPIDRKVDLIVANVTPEDEPDYAVCPPPRPSVGTRAFHFAAYYDLVDTRKAHVGTYDDPIVPSLSGCLPRALQGEECTRGTPYTCMLGGGG